MLCVARIVMPSLSRPHFGPRCTLADDLQRSLMPRHRTVLMLMLASLCCSSCKNEPPDTRALDERARRNADAATLKAAQANDVDGAVANYADDADWLPPNAPMVHGKTAIRVGWAKLIGNPGFTVVTQLDSSGVSAITGTYVFLRRQGGSLKLLCPGGRVRAVLRVIHMPEIIPTFEDETQALASFQLRGSSARS